jgi:two-component system response regulator HydG
MANAKNTILVVDDDVELAMLLEGLLTKQGYEVEKCSAVHRARSWLKHNKPTLALCDYRLPDGSGIDILHEVQEIDEDIPVVLMTGYSDVKLAVSALKQGARDFLTKPLQPDELVQKIERLIGVGAKSAGKKKKPVSKQSKTEEPKKRRYIDGESRVAQRLKEQVRLVARSPLSVLIQGETGTGKEFVARRIHDQSKRAKGPFVAIDCGALPPNMASGELFGYEKGAFTGAVKQHKGCFEQAHGGTLFLDEIGNLSYDNQVRLLRVLQEHTVRRLGATSDIKVDVRILAATNEDLNEAVREGEFREDIYHRLNEFPIRTLPLRERIEDLKVYAQHFLKDANRQLGRKVSGFSDAAFEMMQNYQWPGNLRELRNVVTRSVLSCEGDVLEPDDLPWLLSHPEDEHHGKGMTGSQKYLRPLKETVAEAEKKAIINVLEYTKNNRTRAAALLDIDRRTLYNKLKEHRIDD